MTTNTSAADPLPVVGLDLGKKKSSVAELDSAAKPNREYEIAVTREELERWAKGLPKSRIAMETSTNAYAVYQILAAAGHEVVISNPLMTKAIAWAKVKTNKVDARILGQLLHAGVLPTVWVPDQQTWELRTLCSHRVSLVKTQTMYKNKVHSILARNLIRPPEKGFSDLFGDKGREWLTGLVPTLPAYERIQMQTTLAMLDAAQEQLKVLEKELAVRAWQDPWAPSVKRLITIPGVDVFAALTLLSAIGDIRRFPQPSQLSGYIGIVSSVSNTGDTTYRGSITKRGNPIARWVLVQCAQAMVRGDGAIQPFYERIRRKKGRNVAIVAVARKLLVCMWHMLTTGQTYWYERPMLTQNKMAKLRIKATGQKLKTGPKPKSAGAEPAATGGSNYRKARAQDEAGDPPASSLETPRPLVGGSKARLLKGNATAAQGNADGRAQPSLGPVPPRGLRGRARSPKGGQPISPEA